MSSTSSSQRIPLASAAGDSSGRSPATLPLDLACNPDQATVISQRPGANASGVPRQLALIDLAKQLSGERLNHFQLLDYVGGGGMGAVFKALDTMLNREVALKVLSRDQGADEDTRRRFQNEAQSAARLDHENIARVYYVGEDRGLNYIVFEFIEGVNLRDLVEQKRTLPLPEALSYTLQVANALAHAAGRDVVHRDIKPSNIIVTGGGRAKLVDMGLARLHQIHPDGQDLTASGVTLGTFDYISPEQARDPRSADVRSDIYSLGCTLYFMLTGRPPFPEGTVLQKLLQHNSDAPPDPREFDPALPAGVSLLIGKMLAKDPLRRYQAPNELIADLLLLAEQIGCPLPGAEQAGWVLPAETNSPWSSFVRQIPWLVPVCLLIVAVVVSGQSLPWLDSNGDEAALAELIRTRHRTTAQVVPAEKNKDGNGEKQRPAGRKTDSQRGGSAVGELEKAITTDVAEDDSADEAMSADSDSPAKGDLSAVELPAAANRESTPPSPANTGENRPTAAAAQPGTTPPSEKRDDAAVEPIPEGLLVVGDGLKGPRRFSTFAEACSAAKNGDVVELRFDGPRREFPILFHNQRIEIRAGAARRPALEFKPSDVNVASDRSMVWLSGGSLKLSNVDVVFDLSEAAPSENWSLFTLEQADALSLEQCSLTVRNATATGNTYHDKVAFINIAAGGGGEPMVMMPKSMFTLPPTQVVLHNCLIRGEADLLIDRDLRPVDFRCVNGLIAISERLFTAGEGTAMPQEGTRLRITLDHATALVRKGLCRVAASEAVPTMPNVEVRLDDTKLLTDSADTTLVEHVSEAGATNLQSVFHWEAVSTVYEGFRTFWRISPPGSASPREVRDYDQWAELWPEEKRRTRLVPSAGLILPSRRPLDAITPADFIPASDGDASETDSEDPPAGADLNLIPRMP